MCTECGCGVQHKSADEIATIQQRVNNEFKKLKEKEKFLKTGIE